MNNKNHVENAWDEWTRNGDVNAQRPNEPLGEDYRLLNREHNNPKKSAVVIGATRRGRENCRHGRVACLIREGYPSDISTVAEQQMAGLDYSVVEEAMDLVLLAMIGKDMHFKCSSHYRLVTGMEVRQTFYKSEIAARIASEVAAWRLRES